jgi:hypothetical protein
MTHSFTRWFIESNLTLSGGDAEDGVDDDESNSGGDDSNSGEDGASGSDDDGNDGDDSGDADVRDKVSKEKAKSRDLRKQLRETQEKLAEATENLQARDQSDVERELQETKDQLDSVRDLLNGPYMQSKINDFKDSKGNPRWDWEDAETVFALLDRSDLEVDLRTGEIDGLEDQLEDLAARKPFLLKTKKAPGSSKSGTPPGNPGSGKSKKPSREALSADFPAMMSQG